MWAWLKHPDRSGATVKLLLECFSKGNIVLNKIQHSEEGTNIEVQEIKFIWRSHRENSGEGWKQNEEGLQSLRHH